MPRQVSQIDFGSQVTPPCVGENAQKVGPQALETLRLLFMLFDSDDRALVYAAGKGRDW